MENCIGFENSKSKNPLEEKQLFRVFSIERLLELFTKKELVLVKPSAWDDPFENFILNATATNEDGRKLKLDVCEHIFGQCWSETRESDAMWRIYSPHCTGVKIRTTIGKLYSSLKINEIPHSHMLYLGKVDYQYQKDLVLRAQNRFKMQQHLMENGKSGIAKTLLFKRREFSHENEVRIIYVGHLDNTPSQKIVKISIDPFELIEQIVFDPRIDIELFNVYKKHFSNIGFKNSVIKSSLYELPNFKVSI